MTTAQPIRLEELKSALIRLERSEKLLAIQFLAKELALQENHPFAPDSEYPVWSPLEAYSASDVLMELLANPQAEN
ncbi:MAG TPA: hypothetical protein PLL53_06140 [Saprospiraceae bacterium]|nr:hypothetical protein [Saprospiraceae bacterium]